MSIICLNEFTELFDDAFLLNAYKFQGTMLRNVVWISWGQRPQRKIKQSTTDGPSMLSWILLLLLSLSFPPCKDSLQIHHSTVLDSCRNPSCTICRITSSVLPLEAEHWASLPFLPWQKLDNVTQIQPFRIPTTVPLGQTSISKECSHTRKMAVYCLFTVSENGFLYLE